MKQGQIQKSGAPEITDEALKLIAQYTRRPMQPEELYTFSLILCDNEVDRDNERFTIPALEELAGLFPGKTGIFDHNPSGEKQTARIYRCYLAADPHRTTAAGEPYTALKADAYMVRSARAADLILEIDGGIKKEVSVGCSVASATCSICGADRRSAPCRHQPGKRYTVDGVQTRCHTILDKPEDAYEWSFVAVPSQPAAGITKGARRAADPEADARLAALEKAAADAAFYREKQENEAIRLALLANDGADPALLRKALGVLTAAELDAMTAQYRAQADRRYPPLVQTAPAASAPAHDSDTSFKI